MTDIELWTRILKGDKVAFEELYHRYYSSLFGYALRLNFDEETIKDCLQDMFVKIYVSHSSLPTLSYVKSHRVFPPGLVPGGIKCSVRFLQSCP